MVTNQLFNSVYEPTKKYISLDYEGLKSLTDESRKVIGNRMIDEGHVKLFKSYSEKELREMPPITVNGRTGRLIDGQHRVRAIVKKIEDGTLPKDYRFDVMLSDIAEEDERAAVINANINSKGWTQFNYIECYMEDVDDDIAKNYIMLDKWCREHQLTAPKKENSYPKFRYGAAMMKGINCQTILKNGDFKATKEEAYEAHKIHNEIVEILRAMDRLSTGYWLENMALAWHNARLNTDFGKFMKELKTKSTLNYVKGRPSNTRIDWDYIFAYVKMRIK